MLNGQCSFSHFAFIYKMVGYNMHISTEKKTRKAATATAAAAAARAMAK